MLSFSRLAWPLLLALPLVSGCKQGEGDRCQVSSDFCDRSSSFSKTERISRMAPLDYRNKVVLAPMVRIGELPTRLMALRYGADLVWGPETIDRAIIGSQRLVNDKTGCIEFVKPGRVIYRIHPSEQGRLVYQLGSADAKLAVEAAQMVAKDVAGVDLNCGCPKHFSIQGGMGAALLKDIPRLEGILRALAEEVGKVFNIGITCKIRLVETDEATFDMVRQLCRTGITGLTVYLL